MLITLIKRYLPKYLCIVVLGLIAWIFSIVLFDGAMPLLGWLVFTGSCLFTVPVLMYLDYREIKLHLLQVYEISKGKGDVSPYVGMAIEKVAEKTGIPVFMVTFLMSMGKKTMSKFSNTKSQQKTDIISEFK